ncbi:MAG: hypothetical protein ACPGVC_07290 [Salibacteraceae bacterium]
MKKLTYIFTTLLAVLVLASCQKETPTTEVDQTDYFYSMKGEKRSQITGEIYTILDSDVGTCEGIFFKPTNQYFDFVIELTDGIPSTIMEDENLSQMKFELDIEFTGIAYNCNRSYKRIGGNPSGHPVEIQQAVATRVVVKN